MSNTRRPGLHNPRVEVAPRWWGPYLGPIQTLVWGRQKGFDWIVRDVLFMDISFLIHVFKSPIASETHRKGPLPAGVIAAVPALEAAVEEEVPRGRRIFNFPRPFKHHPAKKFSDKTCGFGTVAEDK